MRWRVLIAALLLAAILVSGYSLRAWVRDRCDQMDQFLLSLVTSLENRQTPDQVPLEQALSLWEDSLPMLSSLLNHEPLEAVGQCLSSASGYLALEDNAGCLAQLREALYLLEDIRNYDRTDWKKLF